MNSIDVSKVEEESKLDLINCNNFRKFPNRSFFENIDVNIEKIVYDVGIDEAIVKSFVGAKKSYQEVLARYEEKYRDGLTKKSKELMSSAYEYAIMFMNSAFILYGDDIVCADDETKGSYVFAELYDRFKPKELPYGNLDGFVSYYRSKNQNNVLERKRG